MTAPTTTVAFGRRRFVNMLRSWSYGAVVVGMLYGTVPCPAIGAPGSSNEAVELLPLAARVRVTLANPLIHSWAVMDVLSGQWSGSTRCRQKPRSVASTIKLAVVNATLREVAAGRLSLDERLTVRGPNDQSDDGEPVGTVFTVRKAVYEILYQSSNTASNLLALRLGGLARLNATLAAMGYGRTRYNYLSALDRADIEPDPGSTAYDMACVARDFFLTYRHVQGLTAGDGAWQAFCGTKYLIPARGHRTLGGKIGSNSLCSTNTGLVDVAGRVYAIVVFTEENGLVNDYGANAYLEACTKAIADAVAVATKNGNGSSPSLRPDDREEDVTTSAVPLSPSRATGS